MGDGVLAALQWVQAEREKGTFVEEECKTCVKKDVCTPEKKEYHLLYYEVTKERLEPIKCRELS